MWWFDDETDPTEDSSGNGNNGALLPNGSEPIWLTGTPTCVSGSCLDFDGDNDYVSINPDLLSGASEATVSA